MAVHKALQSKLKELSRIDPLTGVYKREAFMEEAKLELEQAAREGSGRALYVLEMEALDRIKQSLGEHEGNRAVQDLSKILLASFHDKDLIGRLGGGDFAVLARKELRSSWAHAADYFREHLERINRQAGRSYRLDFSFGQVEFDPKNPATLGEMIVQAANLAFAGRLGHAGSTAGEASGYGPQAAG